MTPAQIWYVKSGAYRLNRGNGESMDAEDRKFARQFVSQFAALTPITAETRLYRGVAAGTYTDQIGHYWSTSDDDKIAESFTAQKLYKDARGNLRSRATGEVLIIDVLPGVRVMEISGVQREFVIEPGVMVTETNRVTHDGGVTYIWLTVSKA